MTRKAFELALVGDPTAFRLCIERVLQQCRERAVKLALPPIRAIETSDFERRLQLVEADHFNHSGEAADMYGAGSNGYYYNP